MQCAGDELSPHIVSRCGYAVNFADSVHKQHRGIVDPLTPVSGQLLDCRLLRITKILYKVMYPTPNVMEIE